MGNLILAFRRLFNLESNPKQNYQILNGCFAILEFDINGIILNANNTFLSITKYSMAELKGQHYDNLIAERHKNSLEYQQFWENLRQGKYLNTEVQLLAKDGKVIWLQSSYYITSNVLGNISKVVAIAANITDYYAKYLDFQQQTEAIYKSLAIIELDMQGNVLTANNNYLDLSGYRLEEIVGKNHSLFVSVEYRETKEYQQFWANLRAAKFINGEFKRINKHGEEYWIQASYNPILDCNNRPYKVIKYATNVKDEDNRLQGVFDTAVDGIVTIDAKGKILSFNKSAEKLFGYMLDEVKGKNVNMLMPEPYHGEHDGYLSKYIAGGRKNVIGVGREVTAKRKDGSEFPMHLSVGEAKISGERIFTGIIRDITEAKRFRDELNEKNKLLEEQDWLKTQVAKVSAISLQAKDLQDLAQKTMSAIAKILEIGYGAFYINQTENAVLYDHLEQFTLLGSYAFGERKNIANCVYPGQGLVGQCILEKSQILLTKVPADYVKISSGLGEGTALNILVVPLIFEGVVSAVIELASFHTFNALQQTFINSISDNLAININKMKINNKTAQLLQESNKMSQELQEQQTALQENNQELEIQAKKLEESQGKLKQQSEELQASNIELEEKTCKLEMQQQDIARVNAELVEKKNELERKAAEIETKSKYKSEFLANMSHELRTPMNSILILTNLLLENKENNLTADQLKSIDIIKRGGDDLLKLINDILDLSKVEAGKLDIHLEHVSIQQMALSLNNQFMPVAKNKDLIFRLNNTIAQDLQLISDRQRFEQIVKNLLSNAFKFTEHGSVTLSFALPDKDITLTTPDLAAIDVIAVSIEDTGIGIPENKFNEIFAAFQQINGTMTRKHYGTGLGLTISAQLAKLLGGEIHVTSTLGKGSKFIFYCPLKPKHTLAGQQLHLEQEPPSMPQPMPQARPEQKLHTDKVLLVIEDDVEFSRVIKNVAEEQGYTCKVVHFGKEGLEFALAHKPLAIILDLKLPDIEGVHILHQLHQNPNTSHIPIQITTCSNERELVMKLGALNHLLKPVTENDIKNALQDIEKFLNKSSQNILVVEDDQHSQAALAKLIETYGLNATTVDTGKHALELMRQTQYDCVILDLQLPDFSGLEILKAIHDNIAEYHHAPVIVYTGCDLSQADFTEIKQYTTNIILKAANSSERLINEISLFLHHFNKLVPQHTTDSARTVKDDNLLQAKKILLVDDDARNIYALTAALEGHGLNVTMATNGLKALKLLEQAQDYNLLIIDIMMPKIDGYELIKKIRNIENLAKTPIIALTAKVMPEEKQKCLQAGANDYLSKPVDIHLLISMIKIWIYPDAASKMA